MKFCLFATVGSALAMTLLVCHAVAQAPTPRDFYPLKAGHRWTYRSIDAKTDAAKQDETKRRYPKVVITVESGEPFERKGKDKDKKDIVERFATFLLRSTSGGKTTYDQVVVLENGVHRISVGGTPNTPAVPINPPLLFFKMPLKLGESWPFEAKAGNKDIKGEYTSTRQTIRVPFGEFDCVVISHREGRANNPRIEIDYWFAADIGMVKQRIKAKGSETFLELERFDAAK